MDKELTYHQKWYQANKDRIKQQQQEYYQKNKEKKIAATNKYHKEHADDRKRWIASYKQLNKEQLKLQRRDIHLRSKYGLSLEGYNQLLEQQNHCCALCEQPLPVNPSRGAVHVDHCHKTGKVRGIVHRACNVILGYSEENLNTLQKAIEYIQKHK